MERKITIEEHVLYKEDYQMKMLKANSPEGFLHVGGRGVMWRIRYALQVLKDDRGIGVVEVILILVVLIGLVIIFKSQLTSLVQTIFEKITSESSGI